MEKTRGRNVDNTTILSKKLCWLLRHGAVREGLEIQGNGFIKVKDILQHHKYKNSYSFEILNELAKNDQKQRFSFRYNTALGFYEIRANQGHTLREVEDDKCFKQILSATEVALAVHGTYMKHWISIKSEGLKRMSRNHVHFATSDDKSANISGFRSDCEILIYLDVEKVLQSSELKLYRSDNNVVLCSGLQSGTIPTKYFKKVVHRHSRKLMDF